ncbi:relA-associated inhibitor-like [Hyperolius riggenbachi]|uniref:relA-associated inhibitor-like n=1 Tax=Hyperolius riggenbachi TaxID=752182 RepID=UPI0035A3A4C0
MVYEKKSSQDRAERSSLGGVPVVKAWRESSLDPAPMKSKGDTSFTLPRGYKFSSMDRVPQGMDRVPAGMVDRIPQGMDRVPAGMVDRIPQGMDRVPAGMVDRIPQGMDRVPAGMVDRIPQGMDRVPAGMVDRIPQGMDRVPAGMVDRIPQGMDRVPQGMDRVPQGMDRIPAGMVDRIPQGMDRVPAGMVDRIPQGMDRVPAGMVDRIPQGMDRVPAGMVERIPQGMDRVPQGMDRVPQVMVDRIPQGMDRVPAGMDRVPAGMVERIPQGFERIPQGMDRLPQGMDRIPQGMDRMLPGPDSVWKSGTGSLPRSLPPQQPISRIPVPPQGGRGQPHRPLPLSMIFQLQNAFWQHHQIPPQNYAPPSPMSIPAAPPPSIPVIPELPSPSAATPVPPPAIEEVPRPLSPTRLQPHLPDSYADVQRVLEDIPRPLRRRGSQEQTSQGPPLPTDRRQYRQIMNRLFGKATPKSSTPEQPKAEEKLQGPSVRESPIQEELVVEEPNFFKLVPIPEEPRPEEKPEATLPKPEEPITIILEASESRVGASALVPGEGEQGVPLVITQSQTPELRSALKGRSSPRKSHPRRARLDPLILLLDGALTGELDVVNQALQEVNDPSQPNEEGITALHNAICGANYHIVNLLISSGANVNAADSHGWTPLHCAASCNDLQICSMLVRHGAAIFATTHSDGSLAVDKCDPYREGYKECLTYLTEVEQCMGETQSGVVYALWDYTAEFADELSVREGDSVTVLRKDGEGGTWWWAALCGREGYIPRNYFGMYPRIRPQRSIM